MNFNKPKEMDVVSQPQTTKTFEYSYTDLDGTNKTISYPVLFQIQNETIGELAYRIVNETMSPLMCALDVHLSVRVELEKFMLEHKRRQRCTDDDEILAAVQAGNVDIDSLVNKIDNWHKDEILECTTKIGPSDEEIFAQSFHRLVHSSQLMEILLKEQTYAKSIIEINRKRDEQIKSLINEQQTEMEKKIDQLDDGTTSEDINNLLSQHYSRQNLLQRQWESELEAKMGHQKNDFRNWIVSLLGQTLYSMDERQSLASSNSNHNESDNASMFYMQTPTFEESFTIYLGSQLKHMHNMRLVAANIYDFCDSLHINESISGANVALGLYSSALSGIILLTLSGQVKTNRDLCKNASMSTEFHFNSIGQQIEEIQNELKLVKESTGKLKPGDFFITRHSNLSQTHVIFHLISDEASNSPEDITSRHPVILGLRNILKTASRYDVTNLSIPALLRHEMSEDMTVPWCNRRADLVFKCAKGFIIESASWGGSEFTLQLVLPQDISYELFTTLSNTVPQVFRLANAKIFSTSIQ
ncbi:protein C12orf4 homolog [Sitodiplosis mosellana]|uniref:protein C12orf4 homolog n=1 Tax=Sitodiplosis mosellana TaxID=263140 RepID=UPI002443E2C6|nr:protein C12orf4 homolog [Sitodiplosis mosellana]